MKKILAIALVAVLALSLLAACGGKDNGNNNGGKDTTNTTASNGGKDTTSAPDNNNNNNGGDGGSPINYPDYWNDEIPKLNGTVTFNLQLGENNVSTLIDVKNKGVIDAYVEALINNGYEKYVDSQDNTHTSISLKNGTWSISFYYYYLNGDNDLEGVKFSYCPDVISQ